MCIQENHPVLIVCCRLHVSTNITVGDKIPKSLFSRSLLRWPVMWLFPVFSCRCPVSLASRSKCGGRFSRTICWSSVLREILGCYTALEARDSTFSKLPDTRTTYATAMTPLVDYFLPKTNAGVECYSFRKRTQVPWKGYIYCYTDWAQEEDWWVLLLFSFFFLFLTEEEILLPLQIRRTFG